MESDFLVIGSGIAGLSFAMKAARLGTINIITKKEQVDTATNLAQGGVAAVLSGTDNFEDHVKDTLVSGAGLCDEDVVRMVVENGPERIAELIEIGVNFVKNDDGSLSLGKEGGHSARRVAHAYDLTGKEIENALVDRVRREKNITVFENHTCAELITTPVKDEGGDPLKSCSGAYVLDDKGKTVPFCAKVTVLCTGGAGKVYLYTSNPDIATGDGVALAYLAGAKVANLEFVQFHPTCLYHLNAKNFLISEAVRGEGAILTNGAGKRFMKDYDPEMMELATRDKVARAIDEEMKKTGDDCVYLDISHSNADFLKGRFPAIYGKCLSLGIDITKEPIPVVPAAHYLCGGVLTDVSGRTTVENLFTLGESACTGLHGGNRLASNSLLEALVYSENAYNYCKDNVEEIRKMSPIVPEPLREGELKTLDEEIVINHNWDIIRRIMWNYVGIVRKKSRLETAKERIVHIHDEISGILDTHKATPNMLELRNITLVAQLVIKAALKRRESRGLHYILDYPLMDDAQRQWNVFFKEGEGGVCSSVHRLR
ncbi:MAG: L-aspartate oxidase [Deltaproteobacteria bacterium]|nr:L-aspartate oxidase [Deltaproteobacteria bacterium]